MPKNDSKMLRYRYRRFMAQYQHDLGRILKAGKLQMVSKFFQDGTWESLAPQTHASFIARCAQLKPQDIVHDRDARELRTILDSLPPPANGTRLNQLLYAVLDRLPPQPPPSLKIGEIDPQFPGKRVDPLENFWTRTTLPLSPRPGQLQTIHDHLVAFPWGDYDHDPIILNQYALRLNDLAHWHQAEEQGYALAVKLFRKKAEVLLRIIEKHPRRIEVIVESLNIVRVRVGHNQGAGLHLLMRDMPESLREHHQDSYRLRQDQLKAKTSTTHRSV